MWIKDTGNSTAGAVIRTDAVRFQLIDENTGLEATNSAEQVYTFQLDQNYPNPFNPVTAIGYRLAAVSQVDLGIYNILGQRVATLVSEQQNAGSYQVEWDAGRTRRAASTTYQLIAGEYRDVKKMILLK